MPSYQQRSPRLNVVSQVKISEELCSFTIISYPLVVKSDLLHHGVLEISRLDTLLDEVLDLAKRHDTIRVGALSLPTGTSEGTSKILAAWVRHSVTATVHSKTEVDLLGIEAGEPERDGVVVDFTDIGLSADDLTEGQNI